MADGGTATSRRRKAKAPTTTDPIEIAMEADAKAGGADSPARRLLIKQERLVDEQIRLTRIQRRSEFFGVLLKTLTGAAGLALAAAIGALIWQASNARGLVVAPFSVPPELAARGLTGEVVASQVVDKLARMQAQTATARRGESIGNDWGRDLKVVIPSTGVSLGELQDALRQWLGHETRVSGEVYRTPAGAVLSVRLASHPAFQASGNEQDFDALAAQVAEQIMKTTQPYRYGIWLVQNGRGEDRAPLLREVAASNLDPRERAWAWRGISREASGTGDWPASRAAAQQAIRLLPSLSWGWEMLADAERNLGHGEAAMAARRKAIDLMPRDQDLEPWGRNPMTDIATEAEELGDHARALAAINADADPRFAATIGPQVFGMRVRQLALLHRRAEARALAANPPPANIAGDPVNWAYATTSIRWRLLLAGEDWPGVIAMAGEPDLVGRARLFSATGTTAGTIQLAYAKMMTGDLAGAAAILDATPLDCDRCLIGRGQLAAAKGDAAGADQWFTRAGAIAPSLPQAAFEWGQVKLARGDAAGAIKLFEQAEKAGPNWAEPLKFEGDAWMALGRPKKALAAYAKAARHAPRWGGLHLKWGEAAAKLGDVQEARSLWRAASGMDLTAAERAELQTLGQKRRL